MKQVKCCAANLLAGFKEQTKEKVSKVWKVSEERYK